MEIDDSDEDGIDCNIGFSFISHKKKYNKMKNTTNNATNNTTNNAMMSLNLYKQGDTWKFDDTNNNIKAEPFVLGMSEMIDFYVGDDKIKHTTITFSHNKFPKCYELNLIEEDSNGGWYFDPNSKKRGWLCPVTRIYMKNIPKNIFFLVTNNKKAEKKGLLNKIIKKIKSI